MVIVDIGTACTGEIFKSVNFAKEVLEDFSEDGFSAEGRLHLYKSIDELPERQIHNSDSFLFIALSADEIIGMIEIFNKNHIYLLLVHHNFKGKGVGQTLISYSMNRVKEAFPELTYVSVNSTFSAQGFYRKLGFESMWDFQFKNGIMSYPMIKIFGNGYF